MHHTGDSNIISATWEEGDQLKVVVDGQVGTLALVSGAGTASASFSGSSSAGIGGGESSTCGNITITAGVTSVTATKGPYGNTPNSIGAGLNGVCGTVYIEPGANVTQN